MENAYFIAVAAVVVVTAIYYFWARKIRKKEPARTGQADQL